MQQDYNDMFEFLTQIKNKTTKSIWIYSGYTYEEIKDDAKKLEILSLCDVLVDGRYVENLKNLKLKFRGSSNQRIIDIQKTIKQDKIYLMNQNYRLSR